MYISFISAEYPITAKRGSGERVYLSDISFHFLSFICRQTTHRQLIIHVQLTKAAGHHMDLP